MVHKYLQIQKSEVIPALRVPLSIILFVLILPKHRTLVLLLVLRLSHLGLVRARWGIIGTSIVL